MPLGTTSRPKLHSKVFSELNEGKLDAMKMDNSKRRLYSPAASRVGERWLNDDQGRLATLPSFTEKRIPLTFYEQFESSFYGVK